MPVTKQNIRNLSFVVTPVDAKCVVGRRCSVPIITPNARVHPYAVEHEHCVRAFVDPCRSREAPIDRNTHDIIRIPSAGRQIEVAGDFGFVRVAGSEERGELAGDHQERGKRLPVASEGLLPEGGGVPLARVLRGSADTDSPGPRIVLFRRPLLARAEDEDELSELVFDVVVEEFAEILGVDPEIVDPGYGDAG